MRRALSKRSNGPSRRARLEVNAPLAVKVRKPRHPPPAVYALTAWSVKQEDGKWFITETAANFAGKGKWRGPYASLAKAAFAIAGQLAREASRRHQRRCEVYQLAP
jgi:hypothetical protein